jgi:predicted type IV restriction endonuclease
MAFEDDFARHVEQIKTRLPHIRGEEATKHSLVVPFFQVLGYDVWNPLEVQPEYGADFSKGKRSGQLEKVDYALKIDSNPVIFVECKAADAALDNFDAQLARYFNATPSVRVAILTNGIRIKVFTDLQQPNMMDEKPWMDFELTAAKQEEIDALKKFRRADFAPDQIVSLAEEMVYYNVLVPFMASQLRDPGEKLVRLAAEEIPSIKRIDKKVVDRLTPILRTAIQSAILDHVARSFSPQNLVKTEPAAASDDAQAAAGDAQEDHGQPHIVTSEEELEAYEITKRHCANSKSAVDYPVLYRDTVEFFEINIGSPIPRKGRRRWFVRAFLDAPRKSILVQLPTEQVEGLSPGFEAASEGQARNRTLSTRVFLTSVKSLEKLGALILAAYEEAVREEAASGAPNPELNEAGPNSFRSGD